MNAGLFTLFINHHSAFSCVLRYSHGLSIKVSDLQEFLEPDLSTLKIESRCLAKDSDSVWYPAQVVDVDDQNHTFTVMFDADESTRVVELDSIVPRGECFIRRS